MSEKRRGPIKDRTERKPMKKPELQKALSKAIEQRDTAGTENYALRTRLQELVDAVDGSAYNKEGTCNCRGLSEREKEALRRAKRELKVKTVEERLEALEEAASNA